ncbi:competence type IV pilus minor pilin ComGG [Neobacillus sp. PS3-40]|uniref:competence type IV pilus minor pilin ComGG n=1 Tax=Neobacillus sp. PS3-40 TaxID=3070679 RepID=UPI0027E0A1AB|nr:competence type IV pilus minor pilin ComGG [Neobacillus sp. PS3-40]WML45295.1 competence type IV pilus minor pilin ComGG [Neobacillus sp. PS3-40]
MIKSEQGFTYPLTLSILMIFLVFYSIRVEQLLIERKMNQETKKIEKQEYYMLSSTKKIEKLLHDGQPIQQYSTFTYKYGIVNVLTNIPIGNIQKITFTLHLDSGEVSEGIGYFDINFKKIVQWEEKVK